MSYNIHNKIAKDGVTKEQLLNSSLAQHLGEGRKNLLGSIFDKFNTDRNGDSANKLDKNEIKSMLNFFKTMAGADNTVTDAEFDAAKINNTISEKIAEGTLSIDYSNFMEAYQEVTASAETEDFVPETPANITVNSEGERVKPQYSRRKGSLLPAEWTNKPLAEGVADELKLNDTYTAAEVLEKLLTKYNISSENLQKEALLADLIRYNPSVFDAEGNVYADAKWDKLDFPSNAGTLYATGATLPKAVVKKAPQPPVNNSNQAPDKIDHLPQDDPPMAQPSSGIPPSNLHTSAHLQSLSHIDWVAHSYINRDFYYGTPGKSVTDSNSGLTYTYGNNGCISKVTDSSGHILYDQFNFNNGALTKFKEHHYNNYLNKDDFYIQRDGNGSILSTTEMYYDSSKRISTKLTKDAQNQVTEYITYEYGQNNTRTVYRNPQGDPTDRPHSNPAFKYSYTDDGGGRIVYRDANGKVVAIKESNAYYHPDGKKWN